MQHRRSVFLPRRRRRARHAARPRERRGRRPGAAPTGAWSFDEGPGSPTVTDLTGNGATGTHVNLDPAKAWVAGRTGGYAIELAPTSAVPRPAIRLAATARLQNLARLTVAAWIYRTRTSTPPQGAIFSQQLGDTSDEVFNLCVVGDKLTSTTRVSSIARSATPRSRPWPGRSRGQRGRPKNST